MTRVSALERARRAWESDYAGLSQEEIDARVRGFTAMVRAVAEEGVLRPERFAELMGIEASSAEELFAGLRAVGLQADDSGNIVGAALTTRKTPHQVRVLGKDLYAWCALDTLFIPGLLGETAEVVSTCPSSGEVIRLEVSPQRIESCETPGTWLSVYLPDQGARRIGPASPT